MGSLCLIVLLGSIGPGQGALPLTGSPAMVMAGDRTACQMDLQDAHSFPLSRIRRRDWYAADDDDSDDHALAPDAPSVGAFVVAWSAIGTIGPNGALHSAAFLYEPGKRIYVLCTIRI